MNQGLLSVLDKLNFHRKLTRRASYILGFMSISAPILFILVGSASFAMGALRDYIILPIVFLSVAVTATLPLAFTLFAYALAMRKRSASLKEVIENDEPVEPLVKRFKKDALGLFLQAGTLTLLWSIPLVIFFVTKDIRINQPLGPGECCLNSDGSSPFWGPSPWYVQSAEVLYCTGAYSLIMSILGFIAAFATKKRAKQLSKVELNPEN